jgi:hypothetical protein
VEARDLDGGFHPLPPIHVDHHDGGRRALEQCRGPRGVRGEPDQIEAVRRPGERLEAQLEQRRLTDDDDVR